MSFLTLDPNRASNDIGPSRLDYHLATRHFLLPSGDKPIWITVEELNVQHIQSFLQQLTEGFRGETIVISRLNLSIYKKLCTEMTWKYAKVRDIIGIETKCLITFGLPTHQNLEELTSRARNSLIIISEERR